MDAFRNPRTPFVAPAARTPKPQGPRPARTARIKPPSLDQQASTQALGMFRTALARLQAATPAVDQAAIYAPYRASEQVAGQLGQGLQSSLATAGQNAQDQYNRGLAVAQQQAAQFGTSAGAGPQGVQNTGTGAIASQSQAQQAAAPQAAAQWQQLLERTAAAKVSAAELARSQGLTSAQQSLSGSLPSLIGQQEDRLFRAQTGRQNLALARTQLTAKQNADYNRNVVTQQGNRTREQIAADNRAAANSRSTASLNERTRHDKATEKGARIRAQKASAAGTKGMPQVLDTLKITSPSSSSTKLTPKGWAVTVGVLDPNTGDPTGETKVIKLPDKRHLPTGPGGSKIYNFISAKTNYEKVPATAGTPAGMTLKQWNKALGVLLAYNPGLSQIDAMKQLQRITPRPPK